MAGGQHRHRTNLDCKIRSGSRSSTSTRYANTCHTISVLSGTNEELRKLIILPQQLWSLIPVEKRDEYLKNKSSDKAPVLDLLPLGYSKVLGKGRIPPVPIIVRARYFSKDAEKKIKEAGGVVQLVA